MEYLSAEDSTYHAYYDNTAQVTEFNFKGNDTINDAEIVITGRYPLEGYAVNDISTALISVEDGEGAVAIKGEEPTNLQTGDRVLINPGEPYCLIALGQLAIRYIATPAWSPEQAHTIE
jgi:hypothetical protein